MKSGWVILDKDSGLFSRTAGGKIARMIGTKKFGHIGTLDPMASGVLRAECVLVALENNEMSVPVQSVQKSAPRKKNTVCNDTPPQLNLFG